MSHFQLENDGFSSTRENNEGHMPGKAFGNDTSVMDVVCGVRELR